MFLLQSEKFKSISTIVHGFFGPDDCNQLTDNVSFKTGSVDDARNARKRACDMIGVNSSHLTHVYQEHSDVLFPVTQAQRGAGADGPDGQVGNGDGLMTSDAETPLSILVADCIPLYFATSNGEAIALAHAGWRGTLKAIAKKTVERMQQEYSVKPEDIQVWIGPGISYDHFEVGEDTWAYFMDGWCQYHDCFDTKSRCIDLKGLNVYQLIEAGVPEDNIDESEECTVGDERFYSYRRQGEGKGHNLAVIMKK